MARLQIKDLPDTKAIGFFPQKTGPISLSSRIHTFHENGHRVVSPKQTIQRLAGVLKQNHINFSSQRVRSSPRSKLDEYFFVHRVASDILWDNFGKDYALGKGLTRDQSVVSGLSELIERFSALLQPEDEFLELSAHDLKKRGEQILHPRVMGLPGPKQITLKKLDPFYEDRPIKWAKGWHLLNEKPVFAPIAYTHLFPASVIGAPNRLVENRPNGLAAGNCLEEAILQAILELVERDAQAIFIWNQLPMPEIDLKTLPQKNNFELHRVLNAAQASGLKVILKDITSDIKIPTIYAFGIDEMEEGPAFQWGVGSHLDPSIAVSRALTELIQVRTVFSRFKKAVPKNIEAQHSSQWLSENEEAVRFMKFCYLDAWESVRYITQTRRTISFKDISAPSDKDILTEIKYCFEQISGAGLTDVIAINHTRFGLDFPVVRVLIPGLEFIPWADYRFIDNANRRLAAVPQLLGYRPSIDYVFGSGKDSNFLL
ncbi:MAG: YcaO-like family protein [Deltaproteobacteria bacterium]|nr:YcaO-like family protein [Deltaproteobacteria bacterium]